MCSLLASAFLARVSKEIHPCVRLLLGVSYLIIVPPWDPSQGAPGGQDKCLTLLLGLPNPGQQEVGSAATGPWPSLHPQVGCGIESLSQEKNTDLLLLSALKVAQNWDRKTGRLFFFSSPEKFVGFF